MNGDLEDDTVEKVSSSTLNLNGVDVLKANQFNQEVNFIESPVQVVSFNTVATQLRSKPGGQLGVAIIGEDNAAPVISWQTPPQNFLTNTPDVPSELRITDDISGLAPASLRISLDNVSVLTDFTAFTEPVLNAVLQANLTLADGAHILKADVADLAGQSAITAQVSFTVDTTPPVISNVQPADGSLLAAATPTVAGVFADNLSGINIASVKIILDGVNVTAGANVTAAGFDLIPAGLADNAHTLSINVADNAGNPAQSTVVFTTDTTPPVITNLAPANGSVLDTAAPTISGEFNDTGSGVDIVSIQILLNGANITTEADVSAGGFNFIGLSS